MVDRTQTGSGSVFSEFGGFRVRFWAENRVQMGSVFEFAKLSEPEARISLKKEYSTLKFLKEFDR